MGGRVIKFKPDFTAEILTPSDDIMTEMRRTVASAIASDKETIILAGIRLVDSSFPGGFPIDVAQYKDRGRFEVYPDKTEVFVWDNTPILKFYPSDYRTDGGKIVFSQKYQVLVRKEV